MKTLLELVTPRTLDDLVGIDEHVNIFRKYNKNSSHPHMLLDGTWGTGKSASIRAMLRDYYTDSFNYNTVWINASRKSERSIEYIESIIKKMAVRPIGKFKYRTFVFEEADQLTGDAEKSLKEAMVEHSTIAKCIFISNHPNKIDGGIKGRCTPFHYKLLEYLILRKLISDIYDKYANKKDRFKTDVTCDDALDIIFEDEVSVPTRDAIIKLELIILGGGNVTDPMLIDRSESIVKKFILSIKKPIPRKRLLTSVQAMYDDIVSTVGHMERDILKYMFREAKTNFKEFPLHIGYMAEEMAVLDVALMKTNNPGIWMMSMLKKLTIKFSRDGAKK